MTKTISLICVITLAAQMIPTYALAQEPNTFKQSSLIQQSSLDTQQDTGEYAFDITLQDSFGNIVTTSVGTQVLGTSAYGAGNGNLTSFTYGTGAKVTYTYDKYNRIIQSQWAGGAAGGWYDGGIDSYMWTISIGVSLSHTWDCTWDIGSISR